jgi:hypothetical protein
MLVIGSTANIEVRGVDTAAVMTTMANDLVEAGGAVVQSAVDETVSCVLFTLEAYLSDGVGVRNDAARFGDSS